MDSEKNHSTTCLMLDLFDKIYSAKENNKKPAIVFLDIKKAFDTVNHDILMRKMEQYGLEGPVYYWFKLGNESVLSPWSNVGSHKVAF